MSIYNLCQSHLWKSVVEAHRSSGKIIVTTNGAFDILVPGHVNLLNQCKKNSDHFVVVGLNSDDSVRKYKSENRPIVPQKDRAEMLITLKPVDMVLIFEETTPINFIKQVVPNIHVNDSDYGPNPVELDTLNEINSELLMVDRLEGSTTDIIEKIFKVYKTS